MFSPLGTTPSMLLKPLITLAENSAYPPLLSSSRESKALKTIAEGWWIVNTTLRPEVAMRLMQRITVCAERESRPLVGSSKKNMAGLATSFTSIQTLEARDVAEGVVAIELSIDVDHAGVLAARHQRGERSSQSRRSSSEE